MIQPIVLAAGLGRRMNASKPLISIDGEPALAVVLRTLADAGLRNSVVVLGRNADAIRAVVSLDACTLVHNHHPETGMGDSLKYGLDACDTHAAGVLVLHVDMPFVTADTVRAVLNAAEDGATLAAPVFDGVRGFPLYVARAHMAGMRATLRGDRGGRDYVARHANALVLVPVNDRGAVYDLDRPSDLAAWKGERCALPTSSQ
jgi:CTP:molybdopterin cytidylyltransferase MocA